MDRNREVIQKNRDAAISVAEVLYGDAAWEITKALTEKQKRREARIGLASNVVGTTAGIAATGAAYKGLKTAIDTGGASDYKPRHAAPPAKLGKLTKLRAKHAIPFAAGALTLQVANNLGDVVAAKVLARESKKKVSKADDTVGFTARCEISKMDTDKRQVFGWASIIEIDGEPVVDYQGMLLTEPR